MAFRKKAHLILAECPDILVVPECEHPFKLLGLDFSPTSSVWHGDKTSKGLAVFSFGDYHLELLDTHNQEIEIVCPINVTVRNLQFILLAVWAQQTVDWDYRYIGQVWKSIHYYESLLANNNSIIVGDFNSNVLWDKSHKFSSHTMTVNKLKELQITSAYHDYYQLEHGKEVHPTFFLYRHEHRPYHIDYCFLSGKLSKSLMEVSVGSYSNWKIYSDHAPLIVELNIQGSLDQ